MLKMLDEHEREWEGMLTAGMSKYISTQSSGTFAFLFRWANAGGMWLK
jgi:predicted N-acyltransferase